MSSTADTASVSAVITSYNDSEYVADAIESVLEQTHPVSELFVVDGGSTDGTREIVNEYDRAKLIVKEDTLLSETRNAGIRRSNGDLIAFLDADDIWLKEKVERQVSHFDRQPDLGLSYTDFYRVTPNGELLSIRRAKTFPEDKFLEKLFVRGGAILPSTVMIRDSCFDNVGYFDSRLEMAEERDMWLRIGAEWPTVRIQEPLVRRRERSHSLGTDIEKRYECEKLITEKMVAKYPKLEKERNTREAHLLYRRGTFRLLNGKSGARKDLVAAIRKDPTLAKAYFRLAISVFPDFLTQAISDAAREFKYRVQ